MLQLDYKARMVTARFSASDGTLTVTVVGQIDAIVDGVAEGNFDISAPGHDSHNTDKFTPPPGIEQILQAAFMVNQSERLSFCIEYPIVDDDYDQVAVIAPGVSASTLMSSE